MSSFRQLMFGKRHRAKNYIDLSVIGSLTINNGIVSGFSNTNYLMTPTINRQTTWTQVFCFTTPANISDMMSKGIYQEYISATYRTRNSIDQNNGTGLKNFMTNNNSGWSIGAETVNNVFSTSTTYYLKTEFTGTQYITSIKTTGDYTVLSTFNSTEKWRDLPLIIGAKIDAGDEGFKGTFNIKESYMILDGVKYEFRFALPLTVVGSPTITDGVVSGFSASNYLQLQQNLDSDNFEMVIDFTTGASIVGSQVIFMNRSIFDLEVFGSGLSSYNWQNTSYNSVIPSTDYSVNTNYKVKIIRSGSTISFAYSKNGGAYISTATFTTTKTVSNPATFGTSPVETSRYFNGSIDLFNSYVISDGTKYIFTV